MSRIASYNDHQTIPPLTEKMQLVSPQEAKDRHLYGALYHGTTADRRTAIEAEGFQIFKSYDDFLQRKILNGYNFEHYHAGCPPPLHHLGFGIYFTTVKTIGKKYNGNSTKGLFEYYADIKPERLGTVNSGVAKTMMAWWIANGYPADMAKEALTTQNYKLWMDATDILTQNLASRYDAVLYKGGGLRSTLDGNQLCVYKPELICRVDASLSSGNQIGSKVVRLGDGMKGVITDIRQMAPQHIEWMRSSGGEHWDKIKDTDFNYYEVKWTKGGKDGNVFNTHFQAL